LERRFGAALSFASANPRKREKQKRRQVAALQRSFIIQLN